MNICAECICCNKQNFDNWGKCNCSIFQRGNKVQSVLLLRFKICIYQYEISYANGRHRKWLATSTWFNVIERCKSLRFYTPMLHLLAEYIINYLLLTIPHPSIASMAKPIKFWCVNWKHLASRIDVRWYSKCLSFNFTAEYFKTRS